MTDRDFSVTALFYQAQETISGKQGNNSQASNAARNNPLSRYEAGCIDEHTDGLFCL